MLRMRLAVGRFVFSFDADAATLSKVILLTLIFVAL